MKIFCFRELRTLSVDFREGFIIWVQLFLIPYNELHLRPIEITYIWSFRGIFYCPTKCIEKYSFHGILENYHKMTLYESFRGIFFSPQNDLYIVILWVKKNPMKWIFTAIYWDFIWFHEMIIYGSFYGTFLNPQNVHLWIISWEK